MNVSMKNDVPFSWLSCWPHHVINQIHFTPPKYCSSDQVVTPGSAILNETTLTSWIRIQPEVRFRRETDTGSEKSEGQEIKHIPKGWEQYRGECTHVSTIPNYFSTEVVIHLRFLNANCLVSPSSTLSVKLLIYQRFSHHSCNQLRHI